MSVSILRWIFTCATPSRRVVVVCIDMLTTNDGDVSAVCGEVGFGQTCWLENLRMEITFNDRDYPIPTHRRWRRCFCMRGRNYANIIGVGSEWDIFLEEIYYFVRKM